MPVEARLVILALVGLISGAFANYLIYSWAYFPRHISPWAPAHPNAPARTAFDRVPVLGWLGLRREEHLHGRWFWFRPLLIELGLALWLPLMYWYYTQTGQLLPEAVRLPSAIVGFGEWAHSLYALHAIIFILMVAATFIDFDEQTIPDIITLPGTLIGLIASLLPARTWLPTFVVWGDNAGVVETTFNVPWPFDLAWLGVSGWLIGACIWSGWCFALADRRIILRRGLGRAVGYLLHGLKRNPTSKWLAGLWLFGLLSTLVIWWLNEDAWRGLLSSLIGLAVGGGVVWAVRIVASAAMGQEAMGFGDVTLMAMIGSVVGWQCALISFFLAPMVAIVIVIVQYLVTRQPAVPFGPYLCMGTMVAVWSWDAAWNRTFSQYVLLGETLLYVMLVALLAMGAFLLVWGLIKRRLFA